MMAHPWTGLLDIPLAAFTVKSVIVTLIFLIAIRIAWKRSALHANIAARISLIGLLVLTIGFVLTPPIPVPVLPALRAPAAAESTLATVPPDSLTPVDRQHHQSTGHSSPVTQPQGEAFRSKTPSISTDLVPRRRGPGPPPLVVAWIVGVVAGLTWWLAGLLRLRTIPRWSELPFLAGPCWGFGRRFGHAESCPTLAIRGPALPESTLLRWPQEADPKHRVFAPFQNPIARRAWIQTHQSWRWQLSHGITLNGERRRPRTSSSMKMTGEIPLHLKV